MSRYRERSPVECLDSSYRLSSGSLIQRTTWTERLHALTDEKTKPCNCSHVIRNASPFVGSSLSGDFRIVGYHSGFLIDPMTTYYIVRDFENSLNWKKLSSSNEAGLLQNLAELDDTVAMFGKNLIKSLSYGGYKWGWAPFLSDVAAVNNTVNNCKKNPPGLPQQYSDTNTITKSVIVGFRGGEIEHTWELKTKYEGVITYDLDILSLYDFIGFHPSPKLIWDLVPLSFAVDWVLPIGNMLDRISPSQGWVKCVNFTGWKMVTATCKERVEKPFSPYDSYSHDGKIKYFSRSYVSNIALEQKTAYKEIKANWPSFSNIMDYAYLANSFSSGSKKPPKK